MLLIAEYKAIVTSNMKMFYYIKVFIFSFCLGLSFCNIQFENISIVIIIQTHKICVTRFLITNTWFRFYLSQLQDNLTYLIFRYSISRKLRNIINRSLNIDF